MSNRIVDNAQPALVIEHLTKTYANGVQALRDVSLTVAAGDFFALLGPNGAGKSTLIGILSALVNKTSGRVCVFGHDSDRDLEAVKRCLGVVPQEFNCNGFETVFHVLLNQAGYYGVPRPGTSARAIMRRRFIPPERLRTTACRLSHRPSSLR